MQETLKSKGLSQSFVSERIGMSRNYLKDCKRLNSDIPQDRLTLIADLLGTTTEYLRDESDDPSPKQKKPAFIDDELWNQIEKNPKALELLKMLLMMDQEQLEQLEKFIKM
jgi:transcriptional regulator with XRE-family HTH domain